MKKLLILCVALLALAGCKKTPSVHPDWTYGSVMYEVNIRQFSPEGTFAGVEAQLPRLKDLGVDILWLMPMYEIGTEGRKGTLGSYYAISDYKKVNPEFGTMEDFEHLLAAAHKLGFKVILDPQPQLRERGRVVGSGRRHALLAREGRGRLPLRRRR